VKINSPVSRVTYAILVMNMVGAVFGQDLGERTNFGTSGFYAYTEAGGQYIPNIPLSDINLASGTESEVINGTNYNLSYDVKLQNINISPDIGYNAIGGFGYQINKNLSLEIECGYQNTPIGSATSTLNAAATLTDGINTVDVAFTRNYTLKSSGNITQIPVLMNLVIQNRDSRFMPFAGIGLGVCPTTLNTKTTQVTIDNTTLSFGGTSVNLGSIDAGSFELGNSQTSYPFMFKLKAGFDYQVSPNVELGLRAFCSGITGSDFGNGISSELYAVIGLNGALKIRF
jgi:opacity protein-like surface antigen